MLGTGSCGLHFHDHSEVVQTPEEALGDALLVARTGIGRRGRGSPLVAEHEVGGGQYRGSDRHNRLLGATATHEAVKLRPQVTLFFAGVAAHAAWTSVVFSQGVA